jgi:hypothetical protein
MPRTPGQPSLLALSRRAGDANIGQTLLRLAALAETAHRYEVARANVAPGFDDSGLGTLDSGQTLRLSEDRPGSHRPDRMLVAPRNGTDAAAASAHTEVIR